MGKRLIDDTNGPSVVKPRPVKRVPKGSGEGVQAAPVPEQYQRAFLWNPPRYKTAEEMTRVISQYFDWCTFNLRPPTIEGLALSLRLDRHTVTKYARGEAILPSSDRPQGGGVDHFDPAMQAVLKRAHNLVIENVAAKLLTPGMPTAGCIFYLKNHGGYVDSMETYLGTVETHEQRIARLGIDLLQLQDKGTN